jgi:hypothetical protein
VPAVFYGWWIVAAGFVLQGARQAGCFFNSFGAYFVSLQDEFGWSRTVLSGAYSMSRLESGFLGAVPGLAHHRLGPRNVVRAGVILFGCGFLLLSRLESVLSFYATFVLIAIGSGLAGFLTIKHRPCQLVRSPAGAGDVPQRRWAGAFLVSWFPIVGLVARHVRVAHHGRGARGSSSCWSASRSPN